MKDCIKPPFVVDGVVTDLTFSTALRDFYGLLQGVFVCVFRECWCYSLMFLVRLPSAMGKRLVIKILGKFLIRY